ncbi:Uncharacterised protein [Chlamydia trachomatis]|nr:Uncharacterised protein [Chlamydia trachomatis]
MGKNHIRIICIIWPNELPAKKVAKWGANDSDEYSVDEKFPIRIKISIITIANIHNTMNFVFLYFVNL